MIRRLSVIVIFAALAPTQGMAQNLLQNSGLELPFGDFGGRNSVPPGWEMDEGPNVPLYPPGPRPDDWAPSALWVYEGNYNESAPQCDDFQCYVIDAADYTVWRDHFNQSYPLPNRFPGSTGNVKQLDYIAWKTNFGGPSTMSLAEPTNFAHTLLEGDWNMWFQPYSGTFAATENNWAHLTQTVAGSAGKSYTFSGWAAFEPYFAGARANLNQEGTDASVPDDGPPSPTEALFAIDFLGAGGTVLSSEELNLRAAGQPLSPPGNLIWQQHMFSATAPAGTTHVRARASMINGVLNPGVDPQSFFVDVIELMESGGAGALSVPEPTSALLGLLAAGALVAARNSFDRRRSHRVR